METFGELSRVSHNITRKCNGCYEGEKIEIEIDQHESCAD